MASFHIRSISLPSRSHPLIATLEEQLCKLNTSQSSLSVGQKLSGLKELYECVDDLLQLTLSHEKQNQSVEDALNGSLSLLDICNNTRDFFSQMRECLRELELSLRRTKNGVEAYMASRKTLNKLICKYLRNLKKQDKSSKSNSESADIAVLLKSVEEISISMFESILSFISPPKSKSKLSIFSKLLQPKSSICEEEVETNKMKKIDAELLILKSSNQTANILKELGTLEMSLKEAEEELECVYRRLVKIRVSLLNSLNH
ncbi:uncharacterized protein LOC126657802 isoform X2 [Mercurialis annua]|uniref:uncharacterized protein LOC126657802 isoform X2 n=1 Tax=Mercurialis annua TaxID=3986 RepID=UPI0024AD56CD|nr:uncharacterized protein LOC126657802 isoform X2 [Mercurialis annua]